MNTSKEKSCDDATTNILEMVNFEAVLAQVLNFFLEIIFHHKYTIGSCLIFWWIFCNIFSYGFFFFILTLFS